MAQQRNFSAFLTETPFLLAIGVGAFLRLYHIFEQIIGDDEWHALQVVSTRPFGYIFSHFGGADYCIPLTAFYKLLYPLTGLSEMMIRAPVLAAGIGSIVILPLMVRRIINKETGHIFAWLLAVSPLHIYFSRYARPYGISLLLIFIAMLAAYQWWKGGNRRWAVLYVVCAVLGPYFHLTTLPVAGAPLLFILADRRGRSPLPVRTILALCGWLALGWILLLGFPLVIDFASLSSKAGEGESISLFTIKLAGQLWGGTEIFWLLVLQGFGLVCGAVLLLRKDPRLLVFLLFLFFIQWLALIVVSPYSIQQGITLTRYGLVTLPLGLLLLAVALAGLEGLVRRMLAKFPLGIMGLAAGLVLYFCGPLPSTYSFPNNWTNHALYQYVYSTNGRLHYALKNLTNSAAPDFYHELGKQPPGSLRIVEAPWYYDWHHSPFPIYQYHHRQWTFLGFMEDRPHPIRRNLPLNDPGFHFGLIVPLNNHEELVRRGVRYVIFHRDLSSEVSNPMKMPPIRVDHWIEGYKNRYGEPVFEDPKIVVFRISGEAKEDQ